MADAIRNVLLRVSMEYVNTEPKVNTDPAKKAYDELNKKIKESGEKAEAAAAKAVESSKKATDSALQVGEGFKRAGEGAFVLARGIAFLSADGDEDMKKMLQTVAAVQGTFDLFKGTIDIIGGTTKAIQAYRAASEAAAAADAARAASTAAATGAMATQTAVAGGATVAVRGLALATGPVGLAIAGIAAVGTWAYKELVSGPREAEAAAKKHREELERLSDALQNIAAEQHMGERQRLGEHQQQRFDADIRAGRKPAGVRADAEAAIRESQQHISSVRGLANATQPNERKRLLDYEREIEQELQKQRALHEKISASYAEDQKFLTEKLGVLEAIRDAAQEQVDAEQKRMKIAAEIGKLTATERAELEAIIEIRNRGGQLTQDQLKRVQELAPTAAGDYVESEYAKIGAGTAGKIGSAFDVQKTEAEKTRDNAQREIESLKKEIKAAGEAAAKSVQEGWEDIVDILEKLLPVKEEIARLKREIATHDAQAIR